MAKTYEYSIFMHNGHNVPLYLSEYHLFQEKEVRTIYIETAGLSSRHGIDVYW